ncbi:hypothetical protein [Thioalkalivibrio sp. ALR17-21]|uniref:hypothetical protein n=1 Tax=Thioalkalivibrio sp. ALR17-21 TaxID=1269813 RepID=UPI000462C479|nr:hypothetical protein [Thioalkalivibrio sp. ALR17-21]
MYTLALAPRVFRDKARYAAGSGSTGKGRNAGSGNPGCQPPQVIGGNLRNRGEILRLLGDLPHATRATDEEVLACIEARELMGRGIGYADAHLLASGLLTPGTRLWTRDRRLHCAAADLGVARGA